MRFLEKVGHGLFIYSARKRLIYLQNLEDKYKNTNSIKLIWMPLHKAYSEILYQIKDLNSKHITFNVLTKYIQHKMTDIEGQFKNAKYK